MFDYPIRPRRLRHTPTLRRMVRENQLNPADFIYPLFIVHGNGFRNPILSMPSISQLSVDMAVAEAQEALELGIPALMLIGIPDETDPVGIGNFADDGIIQLATKAIKAAIPEMVVITDVCLCEYTGHGHCGVLNDGTHVHLTDGYVLNDETLEILQKDVVSHAKAGADIEAPSGMIDGMVGSIRVALDSAGFEHLPIMSYAVKYASAFYGPFRDAADGAPKFGDRKTHQMDPAIADEAIREVEVYVVEGADFLL